jgi:hypothetical protein
LATGYNSLLVTKKIIFNKGQNMAPQRLYIHSHNPLFCRVHSIVNFYIYFSSFKVDFNLLMLYNMKSGKAFLIHLVKLSSLTNKKHIPPFLPQHLVHLLLHTPCKYNYHIAQTKVENTYNKLFLIVYNFEQMK